MNEKTNDNHNEKSNENGDIKYEELEDEEGIGLKSYEKNEENYIEVERKGGEILIGQSFKSKVEENGRIIQATITSLDQITKYTDLFICVHPFIFHGYRIHHNLKDCVTSIFKFHNETLNIWSHLIPFFAFLFIFFYNYASQAVLKPSGGIIYLYLFTSITMFLFSSTYHTFNCNSNEVWNCCFKLDLSGIMFQLISATICSIHFMFHEFDELRRNYTILFFIIGIVTVVLSLCDFFISAKFNMLLIFTYACLFLLSFLSSLHWCAVANIQEVEAISVYILSGFSFMFVGFCIFLAKFPECVFQHRFIDFYCHSHFIWHTCCLGCVVSYYLMLYYYDLLFIK